MGETQVQTTSGPVLGHPADGVVCFRGVPFAASTEGPGRWSPAREPVPWSEPRSALHAGPSAPQNPSGLERFLGGDEVLASEDCLSLNVWTPACDDAARPVMVWIHGGAFETGSGAIPWYDGARLAGRDAVIVTINYRLGVLGFLHLDGVAGPSFAGSGNTGITDQVAALRWVRDNIAGFGGDPGNVTIFGESAGGMSVGTLLGTPAARGLFHKAILQSGAASTVSSPEKAAHTAAKVLAQLGDPDPATLRELPLVQLLEIQQAVSTASAGIEAGLPFAPVVDGDVLPAPPLRAVQAGDVAEVPVLIGTCAEEMKLFMVLSGGASELTEERLEKRLARVFGPEGRLAPGVAAKTYRRRLGMDAAPAEVISAFLTDAVFRIPAIRLAERQSLHQPRTFVYEFTQPSPIFGGAAHAVEIPFVFDNLHKNGIEMLLGPIDEHLRSLASDLADAWVSFARTGTPTAPGLPEWAPYDPARRATLVVGLDRELVDDPRAEERQLWDGLLT